MVGLVHSVFERVGPMGIWVGPWTKAQTQIPQKIGPDLSSEADFEPKKSLVFELGLGPRPGIADIIIAKKSVIIISAIYFVCNFEKTPLLVCVN